MVGVSVWVRVGVCVGDRGYDWGPDVDEPSRQEVCPKLLGEEGLRLGWGGGQGSRALLEEVYPLA